MTQGTLQKNLPHFCGNMKHNAQALVNLLDEFGAKLCPPGMGTKLLGVISKKLLR